ncbi:MAG: transposase [Gammaproteobacteria bacterium]
MQKAADNLPNDVDGLTSLVHQLQQKVALQQQHNEQQTLFINQLLEQIKLARHQHFGSRSERFSLDQMALLFNEAETAVAAGQTDSSSEENNFDADTGDQTQPVSAYRRASATSGRPAPR